MVSNKKRGLCKFNPRLFVSRRLLFRVVFFHVVEHILNVLIILKFFEKFFDLSALLFVYFFEIVGDAYKLCAFDFKLVFFEVFLNFRVAFKWCRKNDFVFFLVAVDFVNAEVDEFEFEFLDVNSFFGNNGNVHLCSKRKVKEP